MYKYGKNYDPANAPDHMDPKADPQLEDTPAKAAPAAEE